VLDHFTVPKYPLDGRQMVMRVCTNHRGNGTFVPEHIPQKGINARVSHAAIVYQSPSEEDSRLLVPVSLRLGLTANR